MDFFNELLVPGSIIVAQILAVVVPVLISVAFLVYAERKVLALIQLRRGLILSALLGFFKVLPML